MPRVGRRGTAAAERGRRLEQRVLLLGRSPTAARGRSRPGRRRRSEARACLPRQARSPRGRPCSTRPASRRLPHGSWRPRRRTLDPPRSSCRFEFETERRRALVGRGDWCLRALPAVPGGVALHSVSRRPSRADHPRFRLGVALVARRLQRLPRRPRRVAPRIRRTPPPPNRPRPPVRSARKPRLPRTLARGGAIGTRASRLRARRGVAGGRLHLPDAPRGALRRAREPARSAGWRSSRSKRSPARHEPRRVCHARPAAPRRLRLGRRRGRRSTAWPTSVAASAPAPSRPGRAPATEEEASRAARPGRLLAAPLDDARARRRSPCCAIGRCWARSRSWASRGRTMRRRRASRIRRSRPPAGRSDSVPGSERRGGRSSQDAARRARPAGPQAASPRSSSKRRSSGSGRRCSTWSPRRGSPTSSWSRPRRASSGPCSCATSTAGRRRAGPPSAPPREPRGSATSRSSRPRRRRRRSTSRGRRSPLAALARGSKFCSACRRRLPAWSVARRLSAIRRCRRRPTRPRSRSRRSRSGSTSRRRAGRRPRRPRLAQRGTRYFPVGIEVGVEREGETEARASPGRRRARAADLRHRQGVDRAARGGGSARPAQLEALALDVARRCARAGEGRLERLAGLSDTVCCRAGAVLDQTLRHYNMMLLGRLRPAARAPRRDRGRAGGDRGAPRLLDRPRPPRARGALAASRRPLQGTVRNLPTGGDR